MRKKCLLLSFILVVFLFPQTVISQSLADRTALTNLSQLKVYFDVKADSAVKFEKRMEWILDTYKEVRQQGLKANFVIGIRSRASFFVTKGDEYIDEDEISTKRKIEKWLKRLRGMGMLIEQCGISAELYDIDQDDFLPEIKVVKNSYVSIAGYQNRGYAYVPM